MQTILPPSGNTIKILGKARPAEQGLRWMHYVLAEPVKAVWFVIFLLILQQLEGNLIYPKVVGKSVGLPGILVLMAVTIGGEAFGVLGMIFSVPVCAVLYSLYLEFMKKSTAP